eukprot:CAMPEP_0182471386 /NCGR_PEP_ID=MMETSP1319-20130603/20239_1 /TAXON_ID=172717 /ORGANISM="Bolidomonas pacifica, Strain RCC208" /LENGTH=323 /DNA_ID=CAMNT_0024671935 /DNA_START=106 /DNA_END=1073 /DNA_ORIENTATION=+
MSDSDSDDDDLLTAGYRPTFAKARAARTNDQSSNLFKDLAKAAGETLDIKAAASAMMVEKGGVEVDMEEIERLETKGMDMNERRKRDIEENEAQDEEVKQVKGRNFGSSSEGVDFESIKTLADAVSAAGCYNVQSGLGKLRFDNIYFSKLPKDSEPLDAAALSACLSALPSDIIPAVACLANLPVICSGKCDDRSRGLVAHLAAHLAAEHHGIKDSDRPAPALLAQLLTLVNPSKKMLEGPAILAAIRLLLILANHGEGGVQGLDKDSLTMLRHELGSGYMEEERQAGKQMCAILKAVVEAKEAEGETRSKRQKTIEESFEDA